MAHVQDLEYGESSLPVVTAVGAESTAQVVNGIIREYNLYVKFFSSDFKDEDLSSLFQVMLTLSSSGLRSQKIGVKTYSDIDLLASFSSDLFGMFRYICSDHLDPGHCKQICMANQWIASHTQMRALRYVRVCSLLHVTS